MGVGMVDLSEAIVPNRNKDGGLCPDKCSLDTSSERS